LRSGKPSGFCAGADLGEMENDLAQWRAAESEDEIRAGLAAAGAFSARLRRLERCGKPVVALVEGLALGGGLEMALACHHRIAADNGTVRLGLPEVTIGLIPGGGGTQRLPRLIGLEAALPLLLSGGTLDADQALSLGLIDRIAPEAQALEAARAWIEGAQGVTAPWDKKGFRLPGGPIHSPNGYRIMSPINAAVMRDTANNYPAASNILRCLYDGAEMPIDTALRVETRYFFMTARTPQSAAMVRTLFLARRAIKESEASSREAFARAVRESALKVGEQMVREGVQPAVVNNLARLLSMDRGDLVPGVEAGEPALDMPDHETIDALKRRLVGAQVAAAALAARALSGEDGREADLLAIEEAGFPSWTGGPISYSAAQT
jgi:enoyl-CoA hydratase/carnithine racemase